MGAHTLQFQKRLYQQQNGLSERTARHHAQHNDPRWVAFLQRLGRETPPLTVTTEASHLRTPRAVEAVQRQDEAIDAMDVPAPAAVEKPANQWTPQEWAEVTTWKGYVQTEVQRMAALKRGDPMGAAGFVRLAAESLKAYHSARADRIRSEVESGNLRPASDFDELIALVQAVASVMHNITSELPHQLMPHDPATARKVLENWQTQRLEPALAKMLEGMAHILGLAS